MKSQETSTGKRAHSNFLGKEKVHHRAAEKDEGAQREDFRFARAKKKILPLCTLIFLSDSVVIKYLYSRLLRGPQIGVLQLPQMIWFFLVFVLPVLAASNEFEDLMGKRTPHWKNVKEQVDFEALGRYKALYDRHQGICFLKASEMKIPTVVHFIWLGPRSFPGESVENVRTWMAQNPDWTFKFWTDRERDPPCHGMERIVIKEYPFPFLGRCYAASENWGEKSDILRYEILYREGGVYVDHDANCLQPFSGLHGAYDFYCGLEAPHPPMADLSVTAGNGVLGSRPGHPVVKQVIDLIEERWDKLAQKYPGKDGYSQTQIVIERTYIALTHALRTKLDLPGNTDIVLPAAYFFAKKGIQPLYSKHFFANSWAEGEKKEASLEKDIQNSLTKLEKKMKWIYALLSFNLLLLAFGIFFNRNKRVV